MPETEDWDEDDEWSSEEEGGELADPDGAPLQDIQSHAPSATAPHDEEEAEAGEHQTDDEGADQGRQKSTYGGSDDEEGYERSHTGGYGSRGRGDDDEGSENGQYPAADDDENEGEEDNYSRRLTRRQRDYGYEDDD